MGGALAFYPLRNELRLFGGGNTFDGKDLFEFGSFPLAASSLIGTYSETNDMVPSF